MIKLLLCSVVLITASLSCKDNKISEPKGVSNESFIEKVKDSSGYLDQKEEKVLAIKTETPAATQERFYAIKDTAVALSLFGDSKIPPLAFNSSVIIKDTVAVDTVNGMSFYWLLSQEGLEIPSIFLSDFKFPFVETGHEIRAVRKDGQIRGGAAGMDVDPAEAISNVYLYLRDTLGWQEDEVFNSISNFEGETGWVLKGIQMEREQISFSTAVQLFLHVSNPYHEKLNLNYGYLYNKDVNIWFATYTKPQFNKKGFCRVLECKGFI